MNNKTWRHNRVTCKGCGLTLTMRAKYPKGLHLETHNVLWLEPLHKAGWGVTLGIDHAYCPDCCKPEPDEGNAFWRQLQVDVGNT